MFLFFVFILFLIFLLIEIFEKKKNRINFYIFSKIIILYFLFIYICWPLLWENPLNNFLYSLKNMINYPWSGLVFYLGEYHSGNYLPWHYLLVWFIVSNPSYIVITFIAAYIFIARRFGKRLLNIDEQNNLISLWKNKNELFSYFNFAIIFCPIFLIIINNSTVYSGWRHVYFVYPSAILLIVYFLDLVNRVFLKKNYKKIINTILIFFLSFNLHAVVIYHPYQNVFFNMFFEKYANKLFEIDYWGLSNVRALKELVKRKKPINVCNLGLMDLNASKNMLGKDFSDQIIILGQDFEKCSHIVSNKIFIYDPNFTKKYQYPKNFKTILQIKKKDIVINELLEKQK